MMINLILIFLFENISSKLIAIPLESHTANLNFILEGNFINSIPGLEAPITIVKKGAIILPLSITNISTLNFEYQKREVKCNIYIAEFIEEKTNITINKLPFCFLSEIIIIGPLSRIGLAHLLYDKENSFIYKLYHQNTIDKLAFSLDLNERNSFLYLGGIENKYIYSGDCDALKNETIWSCQLISVSFDKYTYIVNEPIFFTFDYNQIETPYLFQKYLEAISEKEERVQDSEFPLKFNLGSCILSVDGMIKIIKGEYIVISYYYTNLWRFSLDFFREHAVKFDYEKDRITIYSNQYIEKKRGSFDYKSSYLIIIFNINILSCGILFLIFEFFRFQNCLNKNRK